MTPTNLPGMPGKPMQRFGMSAWGMKGTISSTQCVPLIICVTLWWATKTTQMIGACLPSHPQASTHDCRLGGVWRNPIGSFGRGVAI